MTNLFQVGNFTLHSGTRSMFKIECDSLTDDDVTTLALMIEQNTRFTHVVGVPRGGLRLAKELQQRCDIIFSANPMRSESMLLIVDDVLTTGKSMEEYKRMYESKGIKYIQGVVIFDRSNGNCPNWVKPIFTVNMVI